MKTKKLEYAVLLENMLEDLAERIANRIVLKSQQQPGPSGSAAVRSDDKPREYLSEGLVSPRKAALFLGIGETSVRTLIKLKQLPVAEFSISKESRPTQKRLLRIPFRAVLEFAEKRMIPAEL